MNKETKSKCYQCYNTSVKLVRNVSVLANSISSLDTNSGRSDLDSFIKYKCTVFYNYSSRISSFIITIIIIIIIYVLTPKKAQHSNTWAKCHFFVCITANMSLKTHVL
jgi:hypothetical protein